MEQGGLDEVSSLQHELCCDTPHRPHHALATRLTISEPWPLMPCLHLPPCRVRLLKPLLNSPKLLTLLLPTPTPLHPAQRRTFARSSAALNLLARCWFILARGATPASVATGSDKRVMQELHTRRPAATATKLIQKLTASAFSLSALNDLSC